MAKLSMQTWILRPLNPEFEARILADAAKELQRIEEEKKNPRGFGPSMFTDVRDSIERDKRNLIDWRGHWVKANITVDVDWKLGEKRELQDGGWTREVTLAGVTYRASVTPGQRVRIAYKPRGTYGHRWYGRVLGPNGETVFEEEVSKSSGVSGMLRDVIALVVFFDALKELAR